MNFLVCAATVLAVLTHEEGLDRNAVCSTWAQNAIIGGSHALMGHSRTMIPLTREHIRESVEHGELFNMDGIPVLVEHYEEPESKAFLEDSVLYGYDFVMRTPKHELPTTPEQAFDLFLAICQSGDRIVSR
ncbi:MAG TPA: hypothetical protein VIA64_13730 [Burkholderiales bacterium]|jgi:hypothetical protein